MNFNDPEFLQLLRDRDHQAMTNLITHYQQPLFLAALKQNLGEDQADEVVQGTWVTFFTNVENFKGNSHIRTYLFGILYNKIKELWRSNKKYTKESDTSIEQIFDPSGNYLKAPMDPSIWSQSKEFLEILKQELDKLPENQKMVFYLKEIQGEKTPDICNILNISSTNLGVLLYRAKNNLRLAIERRFNS